MLYMLIHSILALNHTLTLILKQAYYLTVSSLFVLLQVTCWHCDEVMIPGQHDLNNKWFVKNMSRYSYMYLTSDWGKQGKLACNTNLNNRRDTHTIYSHPAEKRKHGCPWISCKSSLICHNSATSHQVCTVAVSFLQSSKDSSFSAIPFPTLCSAREVTCVIIGNF